MGTKKDWIDGLQDIEYKQRKDTTKITDISHHSQQDLTPNVCKHKCEP
jgi:hypothetical protein